MEGERRSGKQKERGRKVIGVREREGQRDRRDRVEERWTEKERKERGEREMRQGGRREIELDKERLKKRSV